MSNLYTGDEVHFTRSFNWVQFSKDPSNIRGKSGQHFLLSRHRHETNIIFWIRSRFTVADKIYCILLSLKSRGKEVAIPHKVTAVHTYHSTFKHHFIFSVCFSTDSFDRKK